MTRGPWAKLSGRCRATTMKSPRAFGETRSKRNHHRWQPPLLSTCYHYKSIYNLHINPYSHYADLFMISGKVGRPMELVPPRLSVDFEQQLALSGSGDRTLRLWDLTCRLCEALLDSAMCPMRCALRIGLYRGCLLAVSPRCELGIGDVDCSSLESVPGLVLSCVWSRACLTCIRFRLHSGSWVCLVFPPPFSGIR